MSQITKIIAVCSLIITAGVAVFAISSYQNAQQEIDELRTQVSELQPNNKSNNDWKHDYYKAASATLQSPHGLRLKLDRGDQSFVLVDVRRQDFYETGHIITAINITTDRDAEEVYQDFVRLQEENPNKDIIIYCYSTSCLNGRKLGRFLAQKDLFVKELSIGFNEWQQSHQIWNYPGEVYDINDYIVTGSEPGEYTPKSTNVNISCGSEAFAC